MSHTESLIDSVLHNTAIFSLLKTLNGVDKKDAQNTEWYCTTVLQA
jgi:hypothetical protein